MSTQDAVRIGELAQQLGLGVKTLRRLADQRLIPSHRSPGGHRLFSPGDVTAALARVPAAGMPSGVTPDASAPDWAARFSLPELDEAVVWNDARLHLALDQRDEGVRIMTYAFTEMLNNAIDHSAGTHVDVALWRDSTRIAFQISDDGRGVFARVREGLGLESDLHAAAELSKGKRTTWAERHSGEGIFFTSKAVSTFRLSANGIRLTIDNIRGDSALGISAGGQGTTVDASLDLPPPRTLRSVFEEFTDDDLRFSRSRPTVKLFGTGLLFVSRSEARRVMSDMTDFDDIDIDFSGVDDVGQGFIDEILRVWPSQHPGVGVHPINMNDAVAFMVRRTQKGLR